MPGTRPLLSGLEHDPFHKIFSVLNGLLPDHAYVVITAPLYYEEGEIKVDKDRTLLTNVVDNEVVISIMEEMLGHVKEKGLVPQDVPDKGKHDA